MTARRIICRDHEVRGFLDGSRTQLRRLVKLRHDWTPEERDDGTLWPWHPDYVTGGEWDGWAACPFGQPGDRLWVAECWCGTREEPSYRATAVADGWTGDEVAEQPWRSAAQMPEWAARLRPVLVDVRLQRLQDLSEADATAEGFPRKNPQSFMGWDNFRMSWDRDHGPESWSDNPYVWALTVAVSS